jgi:predicted N-acetyltransferase YhbS
MNSAFAPVWPDPVGVGTMNLRVRRAAISDESTIRGVVGAAFGEKQGAEIGDLITALQSDATAIPCFSLVAEIEGRLVGHVLFTSTHLRGVPEIRASILAPLAVHPDFQRCGIGGRLIQEGLNELRQTHCALVFVLGHPAYYPRHGFVVAGRHGFLAPHPIPAEHANAWMVRELRPGTIGTVGGQVVCAEALMDPRHWRE